MGLSVTQVTSPPVPVGLRASRLAQIICRVTSLTRNRTTLGPYRRPMPRVLGGS